jgi:hypothetical protein
MSGSVVALQTDALLESWLLAQCCRKPVGQREAAENGPTLRLAMQGWLSRVATSPAEPINPKNAPASARRRASAF